MEPDPAIRKVRFSISPAGGDRIHYVTEEEVRTVLSRLPHDAWDRLRSVHFNDQSRGRSRPGYVSRSRREIALCALPPRISMTSYLFRTRATPRTFGARRGSQWPRLAVRRFMLYNVFLHEVGHLQIIEERAKDPRRKFAMETRAQEFADYWRRQLWREHYPHPDPVHNRPTEGEQAALKGDTDDSDKTGEQFGEY